MVRIGKVQESYGRICPFLSKSIEQLDVETKDVINVLNDFYQAQNGVITEENKRYRDSLDAEYLPDTLGYALKEYYAKYPFPELGKEGAFPAKYIMIHDAHHILLGVEPDEQGELDIVAFEGAMVNSNSVDGIIPLLAQLKAFGMTKFDINRIAYAWELGANVNGDLLENWDIMSDMNTNLNILRYQYNLCILTLLADNEELDSIMDSKSEPIKYQMQSTGSMILR